MTQQSVLTRRAVCIAALSAPCTGMAAPLLDLTSGGGLFFKIIYLFIAFQRFSRFVWEPLFNKPQFADKPS